MVVYTVRKRERIGNISETKQKCFNKNKKKTIKMLIVVTALFGLAWMPVHIIHILNFYTRVIPITKGKCNASTFYMICYWLAVSSCAFNPFIYCYFNRDFKNEAYGYWNRIVPWSPVHIYTIKGEDSSATNPTNLSTDGASTGL